MLNNTLPTQKDLPVFIEKLQMNNVRFSLDEKGGLRLRAAKEVLAGELLEEIKLHKMDLIEWLKTQQIQFLSIGKSTLTALPLSSQQHQLWLHCQAHENSRAYHIPSAALISGNIDLSRLEKSINHVIAQHRILHCSFFETMGKVNHRLNSTPTLELLKTDIDINDEKAILQFSKDWLEQNFDLENGPLLRVSCVTLEKNKNSYLLLLNIHHLLTDGWSNRLLLSEFIACYTNNIFTNENESIIDYIDYSAWQIEQLATGTLAQHLLQWKKTLADCEPLHLAQKTNPIKNAMQAAQEIISIPQTIADKIKIQSQSLGVSPFSIFLAAWQLTLHKLSQQEKFAVACPTANRNRSDLQNIIGFFVNTLPIKADFSKNISFSNLIKQVHQTVQEANIYGEVPLAAITEALDTHNEDFFEACISYESDIVFDTLNHESMTIKPLSIPTSFAKFPLTLNISDRDILLIFVEYNTHLFTKEFITSIGKYYTRTLSTLIEYPEQSIYAYSLLSKSEQLILLGVSQSKSADSWINAIGESNKSFQTLTDKTHLQQIFEQQVLLTPYNIAVTFSDQSLSYEQLNQKSNQFAHYLLNQVGSNTVIGVSLERSLDLIIAILAILKSGNAYLPIDAELPQERIDYMLNDAKVSLVIHNINHNALDHYSNENTNTTSELMYIMYTSGSTGTPKGVRVQHKGVINRIVWMQNYHPLLWNDNVLQKTSINFDVSVWEIFWPLISGARLVFAKPEGHKDAHYLCAIIQKEHISTIHFVPSMLNYFLQESDIDQCSSLRHVFCSGEALQNSPVNLLKKRLPQVAIYNLYGPTEASIEVSFFDTATAHNCASTPMGKPIANTQLHIFDKKLKPIVPGCIGELYIGGVGVTEGYQLQPELTAERFIDNPYYLDGHPSARLYKTGDLVRHLPDGNIEYIGRYDNQVKLRGIRVELSDIEYQCLKHTNIQQAVAIIQESNNSQQLVIFFTADKKIDYAELRDFLVLHLPNYFLPNQTIQLDSLPLTHSGKLDRKALLQLVVSDTNLYKVASTESEKIVQTLWQNYFGKNISIDENFFVLGGHSLLASRMITSLAEQFNVELHFRDIFTHSTITQLAAHIDSLQHSQQVLIPSIDRSKTLPLSHQQKRLYLFQSLNQNSTAYNMPAAFIITGQLNIQALQKSLALIVERHEILHTCYGWQLDTLIQDILPNYLWEMLWEDCRDTVFSPEELSKKFAQQVFDLHHDLPMRAKLYQLEDEKFLFCLCLHHIAADALSLENIALELNIAYNAFNNNKKPILPKLDIQYADYAYWQQQQDSTNATHYWLEQLKDAPELLNLPLDKPRGTQQTFNGKQITVELEAKIADALFPFCSARQVTPFINLLACYQLLLGKLAQQKDICIGIPSAGRSEKNLQPLIGFFVNSLIIRTNIDTQFSYNEYLQQTKSTLLSAFEHENMAIENVLSNLPLTRSPAYLPIAQVGFNFLQTTQTSNTPLKFDNISISPLQEDIISSKYEMTWSFYQSGNSLRLTIEYNSDLFLPTTIEKWLHNFKTILTSVLFNPEQKISQLSFFSNEELRDLIVFDKEYIPLSQHAHLHTIIENQCYLTPYAIAVCFEKNSISYAELNKQANQLAHYINERSGSGKIIAVCLDRSIELSIALLAILKSGNAYLPIDTKLPQQRIDYMLDDAQCSLIITHSHYQLLFTTFPKTLFINREQNFWATNPTENLTGNLSSSLFTLIYTSGSTGNPKGVRLLHAGIINRLMWMANTFQFSSNDIFLQKTPINFDVSIWELFLPLMMGARLVYAKPDGHKDALYLRQIIQQNKITLLHFVPSMLSIFLEENDVEKCNSLKQVFCSGETLHNNTVDLFKKRFPNVALFNLYGPTEASIDVTYFDCRTPHQSASTPIGKSIANIQCHILDLYCQPVLLGTIGELYIGGLGLAEGYHRNSELTSHAFIDNPFSMATTNSFSPSAQLDHPSTKLYKTGDLARLLTDGNIEFLGRNDTQVKLRGIRIELGEITCHLLKHHALKQAEAFVIHTDIDQQLIVIFTAQTELSNEELRTYLAQFLPDLMLPNQFIQYSELPLLLNGKVDRRTIFNNLQNAHQSTDNLINLKKLFPDAEKIYPLTAMQQDIYLDSILSKNNSTSNDTSNRQNISGFVAHTTSNIEPALWHEALTQLYQHADSLRTTIVNIDTNFYQLIAPSNSDLPSSCFEVIDYQANPFDETSKEILIEKTLSQKFEGNVPLWRAHIYRFNNNNLLLIIAAHHAMFDGVSLQYLGRLLKINVEKLISNSTLEFPFNNFDEYTSKILPIMNSLSAQNYWQQQAQNLTQYINFKSTLTHKVNTLKTLVYEFTEAELSHLNNTCKEFSTSPAMYLKSVFALTIKQLHRFNSNFFFIDVVNGRDKEFYNTQGLFFQQQPNVLLASVSSMSNSITDILQYFLDYRDEINKIDPMSISLQHRLLPVPVPYLFNFYTMESVTSFLDDYIDIEHIMPEINNCVNFISKIIDNRLHINLTFNQQQLDGEKFLQIFLTIHNKIIAGKRLLADILPAEDHFNENEIEPRLFISECNHSVKNNRTILEPTSEIEKQLISIWQEVLGINTISIDDNFFELGGHSLSAMRIVHRLRDKFTLAVSLEQVFNNPTIATLAKSMVSKESSDIETMYYQHTHINAQLPPINSTLTETYPLSFAQQRLWLLTQFADSNVAYNIPIALNIKGTLNTHALEKAITTLIERHSILHSKLVTVNHEPRFQLAPTSTILINHIEYAGDKKDQQQWLKLFINTEAAKPFNVMTEPLCRIQLITFSSKHHVLNLTLHHLIADGQSLVIIAQELATLYLAVHLNEPNPLPPLRIQFHDYAVWQEQLLTSDIIQQQLKYWLKELRNAPMLLGLKIDKPRPEYQTYTGKNTAFDIPDVIANPLRLLAKQQGISLFMLLLSSYQLLLNLTTKQNDICIGIPRDGRFNTELEGLIGFFTNALIIRTHFDSNLSLTELFKSVRDKTLAAFNNEHIPAEMVMRGLNIHSQMNSMPSDSISLNSTPSNFTPLNYTPLNYTPIVQAAFNLIHADNLPVNKFNLGDLDISLLEPEINTAKFELLLTVIDSHAGENQQRLSANFEYNSDLFLPSTISTLREQWLYLLSSIAKNSQQFIAEIQLPSTLKTLLDSKKIQRLTTIQRDLYLATITHPDTLSNSIGYALELPIKVNIDTWKSSLQALTDHFSLFRATLMTDSRDINDTVYLFLNDTSTVQVQVIDWSNRGFSAEELKAQLRELVIKPYNLSTDKLYKNMLVKLATDRWFTIFACHHVLLDGMSFTLHAYHAVANYFKLQQNKPLQFSADNYAEYVNQHFQTFDRPNSIHYWQQRFSTISALTARTGDKHDSTVKVLTNNVSDEHFNLLKDFCREQKITPAIYFKCLYAILIQYYCRHNHEFFFSEFTSGRSSEFLSSMGCHFNRQFVVFTPQSLSADLNSLFHYHQDEQLQSRHFQELSLLTQQQLIPQGNLSFSFNYLLMPKSGSIEGVNFNGISYSPDFENNIDLRIQLDMGKLTLSLCYQECIFFENHFLERLQSISEQILAGKISQIKKLTFTLPHEQQTISAPSMQNLELLPMQISLQSHFSKNHYAVICGEKKLTYQQLEIQSNVMANALLAEGISVGDRIAVGLSRRVELLVAILAAVKVGACYVPLDINYPVARLLFMINDCSASLLVTDSVCEKRLQNHPLKTKIINLDTWDLSTYSNKIPIIDTSLNDHFYMIYTSGSTGNPKAASVYHRSVVNLLKWYAKEFEFSNSDKTLIISSSSFDLTQKNFFALLTVGGTIVLPDFDSYDAKAILQLIKKHKITTINCAPSALYPIVEIDDFTVLDSLRIILLGGESIHLKRLNTWINSRQFNCSIVNMYGTTECTDISTSYTATPTMLKKLLDENALNDFNFPMGKPNAGVNLHILDNNLNIVPPGLVGELYVSGVSVGAGYWNNSELTALSFINNPFIENPFLKNSFINNSNSKTTEDSILYRTGDLVCLDMINNVPELFYVGRRDTQVKIRGLRIELGEIEHALRCIPNIIDAKVLVENDELLAFTLSSKQNESTLGVHWRENLLLKLPSYAIPNSILFLQEWPLTPNGKIDSSALLNLPRIADSSNFVPPTSALESEIATLWKEVLGLGTISIHDNFFHLGGDSLKAVRLVSRIEQHFAVELPVSSLFSAQTIAKMAHLIHKQQHYWTPIVPIQPHGDKNPIFAVHALGGMILNYEPLSRALGNNQPFFGLQAFGFEKDQKPYTDLQEMVIFYTNAIKEQQSCGPYQLLGHSFGGIIALEIARQLIADGEEVAWLVLLDSYMPNKYAKSSTDTAVILKTFAEHYFSDVNFSLAKMRQMQPDLMIELVVQATQGLVTANFLKNAINLIDGFQRMMIDFSPQALHIPIILMRATESHKGAKGLALKLAQGLKGKSLGWDKISSDLTVVDVSGDHHSMLQKPNDIVKEIQKLC